MYSNIKSIRIILKYYSNRFLCVWNNNIKGLPFAITKEKASEIFSKNSSYFELKKPYYKNDKSDLVFYDGNTKISKIYIPLRVQSVENISNTTYNGHYLIDTVYWMPVNQNGKIVMERFVTTNSYNFSSSLDKHSYFFSTSELQFYAGYTFAINQIEKICKISTTDIKYLQMLKESDFIDQSNGKYIWIESPQMTASKSFTLLFDALKSLEMSRAKSDAINKISADRHYIDDVNIDLSSIDIKFETWYIPIFVYQYCDNLPNDKNELVYYYKFINGFNGLDSGDIIFDSNKISLCGLFGLSFSAFGLSLLGIRLIFGPTIGVILTGTMIIKYLSSINHKSVKIYNQEQNKINFNDNDKYELSDDDKIRIGDIDKYNQKYLHNTNPFTSVKNCLDPNLDSDIIKYCKLLDLDPNKFINYSKVDIKNAYLRKIKIYHPDIYKNNTIFANNMTHIINNAYEELVKLKL